MYSKVDKVLSPVTKNLKSNNQMINMVLLSLVVFMVLPIDSVLGTGFQKRIENMLSGLVKNPIVMAVMAVLVYAIFVTGDVYMFILLLFLLHRLTKH
mgnify:CR=1 FL=1|tara:strand:+ start:4007 stop:4297 length:291 start_codon:yes stop_codon:yes gene_type:complete